MSFPNTSISERWQTPDWLFDRLDQEFRFTLDAAADETNHKVHRWLGPSGLYADALALDVFAVGGRVWCNPPYRKTGGGIYPWLDKGLQTARAGATCVMLVYARTDTKAWTDLVHPYADEVRLVAGRLKFKPPPEYTGTATTAGAPSAVVIFRPETAWMGRPGGACYRILEQT